MTDYLPSESEYYDVKFDWHWKCAPAFCTNTFDSKGFTTADIDEAMKRGVFCPRCTRTMDRPAKISEPPSP